MKTNAQSKPVKPGHFRRGAVVKTSLLLAAFLIGYVPMWRKSRKAAGRLSEAERHLDAATVENALASAAVDTH